MWRIEVVMSAKKDFRRECKHFNTKLSQKMEGKRHKQHIVVAARVRQNIIFSIINLIILVTNESTTVAKIGENMIRSLSVSIGNS